jgi:hypothetical protein
MKILNVQVSDTTTDAIRTSAGNKNILIIYLMNKYAEIPHNAFTSISPSITTR